MASLKFDITGNASGFVAATREAENASSKMCQSVSKEGNSLDGMFKTLAASAAAFFSIQYGKELVNQIIEVRGEFQQLEIAFETMLGDADEANALMNQLTQTAAKTPFGLTDVANGAKQLLAYGVSAEEVNETLIRLGDIASGLSIPLNDLVFLYGSTMVQGRMFTQDLRQFMGRGIPLADELAKKFGVTKNQINEMVTEGKIGFDDMKDGLWAMTSEGGKFYNLMEKQSSSLTGQMSNLEDSVDMMLNEIGTKMQDVLSDGISALNWLVENYEKVGKVLIAIAATYGSYKAAVIACTLAEKLAAMQRLAAIRNTTLLGLATDALKAKVASLNAIISANPFALAVAALVALTSAVWALSDSTSQEERNQKAYNKTKEEAIEIENRHKQAVDELISTIQDDTKATNERHLALLALQNDYPDIFAKYDLESIKLADILKLKKEINEEDERRRREDAHSKLTGATAALINAREYKEVYDSIYGEEGTLIGDLGAATREFGNWVSNWMPGVDSFDVESGKQSLMNAVANFEAAKQYSFDVSQPEFAKWLEKVSVKTLETWIEQYKAGEIYYSTYTNKLMKTTKDSFSVPGMFEVSYVQDQRVIKFLEQQLASRKALSELGPDPIYGEDYEAAKAEWLKAKAELEKILKDKHNFTTEQYLAAVEDEKAKREAFEKLGGDTKSKKETQKQDEASDRLIILRSGYWRKQVRQLQDFANQVEQARINTMQDGFKKRMAQNALNNKIELEKIKRQKEDYIEAYIERERAIHDAQQEANASKNKDYQKARFDEDKVRLEAEQSEGARQLDTVYDYTKSRQLIDVIKSETEAWHQHLEEYGNYEQKRVAITYKYNKLIAQASTFGERASYQKQLESELYQLEQQYKKTASAIQNLFGDMSKKSANDLNSIADAGEKALEFIKGGQYKADNAFGISEEAFNQIKDSPEELDNIANAIENIRKQADELEGPLKKIGEGFKELFESEKGTEAFDKAFSKIKSGVSDINDAVSFVSDSLASIGEALGSEDLTKAAEAIDSTLNVVDSTMSGAQAGAAFGPWGAAIGAAVGLATSLVTEISKAKDAVHQAEIDRLAEEVENIDKDYEALGKSIDKAYSVDASDLIKQQNILLEQKKANLKLMIAEEEAKKNADADQIKQWKAQIDEIDNSITDNAEIAQQAITGITFDDFRNKFLDALLDMERGVEGFSESIEEDIRKAMYESLLTGDAFENELEGLYEDLATAIETDDAAAIKRIKEQIYALYNEQEAQAREIDEKIGYEAASERSASQKGVAQASQSSVDELNGRATSIQSHTFSINQHMASVVAIGAQILGRVSSIDGHTSRLEAIENSLTSMKSDISDIATRGIRVKTS